MVALLEMEGVTSSDRAGCPSAAYYSNLLFVVVTFLWIFTLGTAQHITPPESGWNRLRLNGRRSFVLLISQCTLHRRNQVKFLKSLQWSSLIGYFKSSASETPTSASAECLQRINTGSRAFQGLETDLHRSSIRAAGDQPWRGCQFSPTATAHSQRWCAGAGETLHRLLGCSPRCSRSDRHHQQANAASTGTLDKQDSHRIRCVHNDAGGFPERSTQPMVGSRNVRRTCRHRFNGAARGSSSARKSRSAGKRSPLT